MDSNYLEHYAQIRYDQERLQREMAQAVRIDPTDVTRDLYMQAQVYLEWGYYYAISEDEVRRLKVEMEEVALPAAKKHAARVLTEQGVKATVSAIEEEAWQDAAYKVARENYLDAQAMSGALRRVVEALQQKRDMIQSLNARHRVELAALPQERPFDYGEWGAGASNIRAPSAFENLPKSPGDAEDETEALEIRLRAKMRALRGETA